MSSKLFWDSWPKGYKYYFYLWCGLFGLSAVYMLVASFIGDDLSYPIDREYTLSTIPIVLEGFRLAIFNHKVEAETLLLTERYVAQGMQPVGWASVVWIVFQALAGAGVGAVVSKLPRYSFLAGIVGLVLYVGQLNLNNLGIESGEVGLIPVGIFVLSMSMLAWYFQSWKPETPYFTRFGAFIGMEILLGLFLYLFLPDFKVTDFLAAYGPLGAIVCSLAFLALIAYEIPAAVYVYLTGNRSTDSNRNKVLNLLAFFVLYLGNLYATWLKMRGTADWLLFYPDAFWMACFSGALGIWGHWKRREIFGPLGMQIVAPWWYLILGVICFQTIGYYYLTGNDPMIEMFEDAIVLGHLAFGIIFLGYLLINFGDMLGSARLLHQVMYKPRYMPVLMIYAGGLTGVMIFVLYASKLPYLQAYAGYYNGLADYYYFRGEQEAAEGLFNEAGRYEFQNHKTNFGLGCIALQKGDEAGVIASFTEARRKKPLPQTYLILADFKRRIQKPEQALQVCKEGLKEYPNEVSLLNNLGVFYSVLNEADSAEAAFELAEKQSWGVDEVVVQGNRLALYARVGGGKARAAFSSEKLKEYLPARVNLIAWNNATGKKAEKMEEGVFADSTLDIAHFSLLFNLGLNGAYSGDTVIAGVIEKMRAKPVNAQWNEQLLYALAVTYFYGGRADKGLDMASFLVGQASRETKRFAITAGDWNMRDGNYLQAAEQYNKAFNYGPPSSAFEAVARAETGNYELALELFSDALKFGDEQLSGYGAVSKLLNGSVVGADYSDKEKYLALHLNRAVGRIPVAYNYYNSIQDPVFKTLGALDLANSLMAQGYSSDARNLIYSLVNKADDKYAPEVALAKMRVAIALGEALPQVSEKVLALAKGYRNYLPYIEGYKKERAGDIKSALSLYEQAVYRNPVDYGVLVKAIGLMNGEPKQKERAYDLLLKVVNANQYNAEVQFLYVQQCLALNYDFFAETAMERLSQVLPKEVFGVYLDRFEALKAKKSAN